MKGYLKSLKRFTNLIQVPHKKMIVGRHIMDEEIHLHAEAMIKNTVKVPAARCSG
jgi:ribonucleotide reductase beta subunit family protein with ferritin-like domain